MFITSNNLISAGTLSPVLKYTISPGTNDLAYIDSNCSPRRLKKNTLGYYFFFLGLPKLMKTI